MTTDENKRARAERDKATELFLTVLAETGNVTKAAKKAKLGRTGLYYKRGTDKAFALAWARAEELGAAALEDEARRRACEGLLEPVFYQGKRCGSVRKYSDSLLVLLLKAHMPGKYRDNAGLKVSGGLDIITTLDEARDRAKKRL